MVERKQGKQGCEGEREREGRREGGREGGREEGREGERESTIKPIRDTRYKTLHGTQSLDFNQHHSYMYIT